MWLNFAKYDAAGNDFIMVMDERSQLASSYRELSMMLCDRHHGIGADGMIFLTRSRGVDFKMNYFNSDGNGPVMCGNGARASVLFFCEEKGFKQELKFLSVDGLHYARVKKGDRGPEVEVSINVEEEVTEVEWEGSRYPLIDSGVPHLILPRCQEGMDYLQIGRRLREHFNSNVNFLIYMDNNWYVRTYERGVEEITLSCGTGAVAISIYLSRAGIEDYPIKLFFPGGKLLVRKEGGQYYLSGPVRRVFEGRINI